MSPSLIASGTLTCLPIGRSCNLSLEVFIRIICPLVIKLCFYYQVVTIYTV